MKSKFIFVLIICFLLIAGFNSITSAESIINNSTDDLFYEEIIKPETSKNTGDEPFDIFIEGISWYSPNPLDINKGVLCFNILIDSVGDWDDSKAYANRIIISAVFSNGENEIFRSKTSRWGRVSSDTIIMPELIWIASGPILGENVLTEKPTSLIVELTTSYPGEASENNNITVDVELGITINGYINCKDKEGVKTTPFSYVKVLSEENHFIDYYFRFYVYPENDGYYYCYAPYISGVKYSIEVFNIDSEKSQSKYINSPIEFTVYDLDFLFTKSQSFNLFKTKNMIVSFLETIFKKSFFNLLK